MVSDGLMMSDTRPVWLELKFPTATSTYAIRGNIESDSVNWQIQNKYSGYSAYTARLQESEGESKSGWKDYLADQLTDLTISEL